MIKSTESNANPKKPLSQKKSLNVTTRAALQQTASELETLYEEALLSEAAHREALQEILPSRRDSACNLLHYLSVRRHDIRDLQRNLSHLGLSSLGRMEAHVLASLGTVISALSLMDASTKSFTNPSHRTLGFDTGNALLARHTKAIFGSSPVDRSTYIMVTAPSEAADEPSLISDMLANGMNLMRINCAHDDEKVWRRMVRHLRAAEKALGRQCKIEFDLAGPKLRTGRILPVEGVVKCRPERDQYGQVLAPAVVSFTTPDATGFTFENTVPMSGNIILAAQVGDTIKLIDARDRQRKLVVIEVKHGTVVCESNRTAYLIEGTTLSLWRGKHKLGKGQVDPLPPLEQVLRLAPGDMLDLVSGSLPGHNALIDAKTHVAKPAMLSCDLAEVFASVKVGERIMFDDGIIAGIIKNVTTNRLCIEIVNCVGGTGKLAGEKGINLPDTLMSLPALTSKDRADLDFVVKHADMVALSFVQTAQDIEDLAASMKRPHRRSPGIVLKIETKQAFEQLPALLLGAMRYSPVAVMVARGDLGVEIGFDRLSEVQEEILWLCEAAHIPVIWATQVLESLAKNGVPSRAEVTDAAMSTQAECVMLNKGPYITDTLKFLCNVLTRMQSHHEKKASMLRKLHVSSIG